MTEQTENLERVNKKIGALVRGFVSELADFGGRFTIDDLLTYVTQREPRISPDSPSRILRAERQKGRINYKCISRSESLYMALPVEK